MACCDLVATFGGAHAKQCTVFVLFKGSDLRGPTQIDTRSLAVEFLYAFHQIHLYIKLLDVGEGWLLAERKLAFFTQVKRKYFVVASEGSTHLPCNAFGGDALVNAQALKNFQRLLGVANASGGCAFDAYGVVFIQKHRRYAQLCQAASQCKTC